MRSDAEIEALVRAFEDGTLPRADWTHREHLTVALWYLRAHSQFDATRLIRDGIQKFNAAHGNHTGYHETITLAWIAVVVRFRGEQMGPLALADEVAALLDICGDKNYLLRFYSKDVLMSDAARRSWVPPDLQSIG